MRAVFLPLLMVASSTFAAPTAPSSTQSDRLPLTTAPELVATWKPFATWKTANEKPTKIVATNHIAEHFDASKNSRSAVSMLRQADAGAIAFVAPCREGKPHFTNPREDFRLMVQKGKLDGTTLIMARFWEWGIRDNLTAGEHATGDRRGECGSS